MKKMSLMMFVLSCLLLVGVTTANASEVQTQTINSIEKSTWISNKGGNHDRQDLGFILNKNVTLKVRQVNPDYTAKLNLRLLGTDRNVEKLVPITSEWVSVTAENILVPFIDSPFGSEDAVIEYEIESEEAQKPLAIYSEGDNETNFFQGWDESDGEFALIKSPYFQLLVPKVDKEAVRSLKEFNSLDEYIQHMDGYFDLFDEMVGLDNSGPVHKKVEQRYFLKADLNGAGGAVYTDYMTASSKTQSIKFWLRKEDNWGTLHEIAHGYQADFEDRGLYTTEVSNNLFGVQYQYETYGKEAEQIGWLFNYGKKTQAEEKIYDHMMNNGTYASADGRGRLLMLTMLKQKAGNQAFANLNKGYRETRSQPGFDKTKYTYTDLMNQYYSEHSKLDFTPVLERMGLKVDSTQTIVNQSKNYNPIAFLADVVPKSELAAARAIVDENYLINSNFEIVSNQEIASLGLKGNVSIDLDVDN